LPDMDDSAPVHRKTFRVSTCGAENAARIIERYGSTGCGTSILEAVKQNPRDGRDMQMSYKDVANLREVAARMRYKFDPDDACSVWRQVRSRNVQ
jgi:hypothetical protein